MRPEALLVGAAVAALVLAAGLAAVVPGFVGEPATEAEPPAHLSVAEMTLSAGEVTGETATLETTAYVLHRGGPAENVTVRVRATDSESGLVVDTTSRELGGIEGGGEREVPVSVTVPREGGYDVEVVLYVGDERVDTAGARVSGVGALTPPRADSEVGFHEFLRRPAVEYTVRSVEDGEATLSVTSYLTNGGDDPESDLRLVVTAREADANVVADRAEVAVGAVEPGRTAAVEASVTVPDDHNYYLDATLWRDGVVLESTRSVANLDPSETLAANETRRDVEFEAGDFETRRPEAEEPTGDAADGATAEPESQAGFGAAVAVVALLGALLLARRRSA